MKLWAYLDSEIWIADNSRVLSDIISTNRGNRFYPDDLVQISDDALTDVWISPEAALTVGPKHHALSYLAGIRAVWNGIPVQIYSKANINERETISKLVQLNSYLHEKLAEATNANA